MTQDTRKPQRTPANAAEDAPASTGKDAAPPAKSPSPKPTGRVAFDDRGNAVWEWSVSTGAFGRDVSARQLAKHEHPALSIVDDAPPPGDALKANPNPLGTVRGYNPYESGQLEKKAQQRSKDLKKLGAWIAARKQQTGDKDKD